MTSTPRKIRWGILGPGTIAKAFAGGVAHSRTGTVVALGARNPGKPGLAEAFPGARILNISSDAAVNAYPGWGAYGASKAALRHLTAIWSEEARADGVEFRAIDPGDMDTPLHALAVPDADRSTLKRPEDAAAEIIETMLAALPANDVRQAGVSA